MGKVLLVVIPLVLLVYAFFDLYATPRQNVQHLPKWSWYVLVFLPLAGPLLWLFLGATKQQRPPDSRPQRGGAVGPDDDPDFLRGL
jgi:hypothetical protein